MTYPLARFRSIYGVDFSGAKLAGENTWIAQVEQEGDGRHAVSGNGNGDGRTRLRLVGLKSLESLAGAAEREAALGRLVELIRSSDDALWAMDFPFAMPLEVMARGCTWRDQLAEVARWRRDAYSLGVRCCERAMRSAGRLHIRRRTDSIEKTPFDCYHYRIIYQTFHGMRDVLRPLSRCGGTAVLPFDYRKLGRARRAVIESCPGSTLKRLGWPHQNYKQPAGGSLTAVRRRTRRAILDAVAQAIEIGPAHRRLIMRNPGGDALDAVLAALGAALRWEAVDHRAIARDRRFVREGYVYA